MSGRNVWEIVREHVEKRQKDRKKTESETRRTK